MKNITIAILLYAISLSCSAQEFIFPNTVKSYIAISVGPSFPIGNYANKSTETYRNNLFNFIQNGVISGNNPGLARAGYHITIDGVYSFSQGFGFAGMISLAHHAFTTSGFEDEIANNAIYTSNTQTGSFTANSYTNTLIMGGPSYGINIGEKITIDLRVLFGAFITSYPTQTLTNKNNGVYIPDTIPVQTTIHTDAPTALSFGACIGAMIRYHIKPHIGVYFKGDLMFAGQTYNMTVTASQTYPNKAYNFTEILPYSYDQSVVFFNFGFGAAYEF